MPTAATDDPPVDDDNAVINNVDDNDRYPTEIECTDANDDTFLQSWNDFVTAFENSPTYARAHSVARTTTSHVVNDDDEADTRMTSEDNDSTPPPPESYVNSLSRLKQVLGELEQVNNQLFQLINAGAFTAPNVLPPLPHDNPQQPKLCPEPPHDRAPQNVILQVPPPAPDLVGIPLQQPIPQIPESASVPCRTARYLRSTKTTIPNWAKPAVPPTAALNPGNPHWPPPRPNPKTTPYMQKYPAKHIVTQRSRDKYFLRPP